MKIREIKETKTNQNEVRVKLTLKRKHGKRVNVSFAILTAPGDVKTESFHGKVFLSVLCWHYVSSDSCFAEHESTARFTAVGSRWARAPAAHASQ